MAPLPQNNTKRVLVDYVTGSQPTSQEHTMQFRFESDSTNLAAQEEIAAFLLSIGASNFRQGWRVLRVRVGAALQNFTVPVSIQTDLAAFLGTNTGAYVATQEAQEWTWQGRSFDDGRRVDISVYGLVANFPANFRYVAGSGAPTWVANSVDYLNANAASTLAPFRTIGGGLPVWYGYVNANYNSYWERRLRSV